MVSRFFHMPTINHKQPPRPWIPVKEPQGRRWNKDKRYNSYRWRKRRATFLKANPLCVDCELQALGPTPATVVDHRIQVSAGADFWDEKNWQPMCTTHHNQKSGRESHVNNTKPGGGGS